MVSLNDRQELAALCEADPHLKSIQSLLDGERLPSVTSTAGIREKLLFAISCDDSTEFNKAAEDIGQRRISPQSDWCQDDYLIFLLVLGNQKFGHPLGFLSHVIEARRENPNRLPQKINEVFSAIERGEFGIDGEFGFLKIPFLHVLGKFSLGPAEARKAIQAMSTPGLLGQMSPFLKLLTQKAYDLILIERQPRAIETTTVLIKALEAHAKDLSPRDWWRVFTALPGRVILTLLIAFAGLGLIPVLVGVGKGLVQPDETQPARIRPAEISVTAISEPGPHLPVEILLLAKAMSPSAAGSTNRSILIEVQAKPFANATPSFVVEASHPGKPIKNAIAFTSAAAIHPGSSFTVLPVQRDAGRVRAILPELAPDTRMFWILEFGAGPTDDAKTIGSQVLLRSLQ